MGVDRIILNQGNGPVKPKMGDTVRLQYTGYLYEESKANYHKGKQFDASKDRGDGVFETIIGVGKVIKGWDLGVLEMSVDERSILAISSDYAYGDRGFPGLIPSNADLVL